MDADTILVLKGDSNLCFSILEHYSECLRDALVNIGEKVIYIDPEKEEIGKFIGKKYKAIIGFLESSFYSIYPNTGINVYDLMYGPKFNFWFDHPAFYYKHIKRAPKNYHILTHDKNYVKFIKENYSGVDAIFFPPGGLQNDKIIPFAQRKYDVSFVGTFADYKDILSKFDLNNENTKIIVNKYFDILKNNPAYTADIAYTELLKEFGIQYSNESFVEGLSQLLVLSVYGASRYFRQEAIKAIVEGGIAIDVFGEGWDKAPYADNPNLRIHSGMSYSEAYKVYRDSRMSLNFMTWHKDSITERVLDIMMSGTIALSDYTSALCEEFIPDKEIVLFSLDNINRLPEIIKENKNSESIAIEGYNKVVREYTWEKRAEKLMSIIRGL